MFIKNNLIRYILSFSICIISSFNAIADKAGNKLELPRFVTIKFNEVNARTGPSAKCPIEWVFVKKGEPVKIIAEYEQWRKVVDIEGEGGWVKVSALSGKRSVVIVANDPVFLHKSPNEKSKIAARLMPQVRCYFKKCKADWCRVVCQGNEGWIAREAVWGIKDSDV